MMSGPPPGGAARLSLSVSALLTLSFSISVYCGVVRKDRPVFRHSPSLLAGFRGTISLLSSGTMRVLRLLKIRFGWLRFPSPLRYLAWLVLFVRSTLQAVGAVRLDVGKPVRPFRFLTRKPSDLHVFPGNPSRHLCPALRPRPNLNASLLSAYRCCPRKSQLRGLRPSDSFEAESQGLNASCQRFVPPSPMTTHDSLLAGCYPFTRRVLDPLGPSEDFSCWIYIIMSWSLLSGLARRDVNESGGW